jgi:hypothetical protein
VMPSFRLSRSKPLPHPGARPGCTQAGQLIHLPMGRADVSPCKTG